MTKVVDTGWIPDPEAIRVRKEWMENETARRMRALAEIVEQMERAASGVYQR